MSAPFNPSLRPSDHPFVANPLKEKVVPAKSGRATGPGRVAQAGLYTEDTNTLSSISQVLHKSIWFLSPPQAAPC